MSGRRKSRFLAVVLAGAAVLGVAAAARGQDQKRSVFDVRDFGATGDGTRRDTAAIDAAIDAAAAAGGGVVELPPGTYLSGTIHLRSRVVLRLDAGATVVASERGFDPPEENPFAAFQDFGHSHFHNALLVGDGVEDVAIEGSGTLDGRGLNASNAPRRGQGDKILALRSCARVRVSGVTFTHGGHIAIAMNGCRGVAIDDVRVLTRDQRDGIDVVGSSDVVIRRAHVEAGDDAIVFKSDWALGRSIASRGNRVSDSTVASVGGNALKIGTETCGDVRDLVFRDVRVTGAGGAGIGLVTLDGGTIESVTAERIEMRHVATPVLLQIGDRGRCPGKPPPGALRHVALRDVRGVDLVGPDGEQAATIMGMPAHPIEDVTLERVELTVPGGHPRRDADADPREPSNAYAVNALGVRPAYGWWVRHVDGLVVRDCSLAFARDDGRPALVVQDGRSVVIEGLRADRGAASPYDVGLNEVAGYSVVGGGTADGHLRVEATWSAPTASHPRDDVAAARQRAAAAQGQ